MKEVAVELLMSSIKKQSKKSVNLFPSTLPLKSNALDYKKIMINLVLNTKVLKNESSRSAALICKMETFQSQTKI